MGQEIGRTFASLVGPYPSRAQVEAQRAKAEVPGTYFEECSPSTTLLWMEINRGAPAIAEGHLEIKAPPATVWSIISDIESWPTWNPDVSQAKLDGPLAVGTGFRWRAGTPLRSVLRVVEPPREIAWTGTTMGIRAIHVYRFDPRNGGTLASSEESWEGLLPALLKGFSRKTLEKGIRNSLGRLKTEAEGRLRRDTEP